MPRISTMSSYEAEARMPRMIWPYGFGSGDVDGASMRPRHECGRWDLGLGRVLINSPVMSAFGQTGHWSRHGCRAAAPTSTPTAYCDSISRGQQIYRVSLRRT